MFLAGHDWKIPANSSTNTSVNIVIRVIRGYSGADIYAARLLKLLNAQPDIRCSLEFLPHWLQYTPWAMRFLPRTNADVIISNAEYCWALREPQARLIGIVHQNIFTKTNQQITSTLQKIYHYLILRPNLKKTLRQADTIIAVANHLREFIVDLEPSCNCIVIPNAVDTAFFRPALHECSTKSPCKILFVGKLSKLKGAGTLGQVARMLGDNFQIRYTTGLRLEKTRKYFEEENMVCLGSLTQLELQKEYQTSDIFLLPSRTEGMSLALLEALSSGCVPVVTNCPGNSEIIHNQINGAVCTIDSVADICKRIRELWNSSSKREKISRLNREIAIESYSSEVQCHAYLQVLGITPPAKLPHDTDELTLTKKNVAHMLNELVLNQMDELKVPK